MEIINAKKDLEILQYPHPYLETKSEPINFISRDIILLSQNMVNTMELNDGIGLSANQVGALIRMFVMKVISDDKDAPQYLIALNPAILEKSDEIDSLEGCLSFDFLEEVVPVKRSGRILLSYCDLNANYNVVELTGINAICAQHEIDHLDGITFVDKTTETKKKEIIQQAVTTLTE